MFKQNQMTQKVGGIVREASSLLLEAVLGSAVSASAACGVCGIFTYSTCGACSGTLRKKYRTDYETNICTQQCGMVLIGCVPC